MIMRKTKTAICIVGTIALLTSCKKDWVCNCSLGTSSLITTQIFDQNRKTARKACKDRESSLITQGLQNVDCKLQAK